MCGFGAIATGAAPDSSSAAEMQDQVDSRRLMMQEWVAMLLASIGKSTDSQSQRLFLKSCARAHYDNLKMDQVLEPYVGDIEKFNAFLSNEWKWKITYDKVNGVLLADEDKSYCVCPMVNHEKNETLETICYCSEGFAELMFSKVAGEPVTAEVISSIHRGDKSCVYKVSLL